jgi:hypothetical protein
MFKNKPFPFLFPVSFFLFICFISLPAYSQKIKIYDLVKDFKAVPDNKTDNYLAFVKAAETLSRAGGGQLNIPKGNYYIAAYKTAVVNKLYTARDIVFINCNNLIIIGNNSVIRVNGNFTRKSDYQLPGLSNNYSYNNTVCPFKIMNCKNVLLKDITLNGEVDKMRKGQVVEGESYGVFISDDEPGQVSSKVVIQNVTTHHFAADGLLIKSNGEDILINKCNSYKNARQGLSIVKGKNIKVLNSSFDSTGVTGGYGWHAPGAGIDVENEFGPGLLSNVLIRNCTMRGNNGFQIVTTLPSDKVIIDSCFISDPSAGFSDALHGVGMYSLSSTISNCIIFAGIQVDVADQIYKGPMVQEINKNIIYSGDRAIVSSDFGRPVNITDNIIIMLPKPKIDGYFLYIQNFNSVFNRNMVVVHADRLKKEPNTVVVLTQFAKEVMEDFWLVNGYDIPVEKKKTVSYMIATDQVKKLKEHFFSPSNFVSQYNFYNTHFLTDVQVNSILNKELFSAYKQISFSPKYLAQANDIRRYEATLISEAKKKK